MAVDAEGTAIAIWLNGSAVRAARFNPGTGSWLLPALLVESGAGSPQVSLNAAGDGFAAWVRTDTVTHQHRVEAMRYSATSRTWNGPFVLPNRQYVHPFIAVATDDSGNGLVMWVQGGTATCPQHCLQAARYVATDDAWTLASNLTDPAQVAVGPVARFDAHGNAVATWGQQSTRFTGVGYLSAPQAITWRATLAAPTITGVTAGPGSLTLAFAPPSASEISLEPINYAYSTDNGATWTVRDPVSPVSPLVVEGLENGTQYAVRLRAINAAGAGLPSAAVTAVPGEGLSAPSGLTVANVTGRLVTLTWLAPSAGVVPAGYVLEGGVNPGEVLVSVPTGSTAPMFVFTAPAGTFHVRVRAVAGAVQGPASNEVPLVVNVPAAPSAPENLLGLVNGSTATLSWTNSFGGGAPTSLWLSVTGDLEGVLPLPMGDAVTIPDVPAGTYTVRVVAANASGVSAPSNPVTLIVPSACEGGPVAPAGVQAWVLGRTIFVSWQPPPSGSAVTSYTVNVTGAYTGSFSTRGRMLSGTAGPGTYTLSVVAHNACGQSAPAAAGQVVIP